MLAAQSAAIAGTMDMRVERHKCRGIWKVDEKEVKLDAERAKIRIEH
jgi:hypothetical protein